MPTHSAPSVSQDRFLDGRLVIQQPLDGYRAGADPILLAAAVPAKAGESVLDAGCGVGTAALCLLFRVPETMAVGLELQPPLAALARENAAANGMAERLRVLDGCLTSPPGELVGQQFHHVITNPPWYPAGTINPPAAVSKAVGHVEEVDLTQWLSMAARFLRPKGRLTIIHRADRLGDILVGLAALKLGAVRVLPLWPKAGRAAIRVIVSARKEGRAPLELLPGLILHQDGGAPTSDAERVLRHGGALD